VIFPFSTITKEGVGVGVMVGVNVAVAVGVAVRVGVLVGVDVSVGVLVAVGLNKDKRACPVLQPVNTRIVMIIAKNESGIFFMKCIM